MEQNEPTQAKINIGEVLNYLYLVAIALALVNNIEHLATVHFLISQQAFPVLGEYNVLNKAHSVLAVLIFDVVLFALILKGEVLFTRILSLLVFVLNLVYYDVMELYSAGEWEKFSSAVIFSLVFSLTPLAFAELYARRYKKEDEDNELHQQMVSFRSDCITLRAELEQQKKQHSTAMAELEQKRAALEQQVATLKQEHAAFDQERQELHQLRQNEQQRLATLKCKWQCGYQAESESQKRSHEGHCEKNPRGRS